LRAQILGVDCLHTRDVRHTHRLLCRHILAIRSIPIFAHCKAVLIFESNLAFESQHLLHAIEANGIKNWVSLSEGQQGTLGWLTTHERKVRLATSNPSPRPEQRWRRSSVRPGDRSARQLSQKHNKPFYHMNIAKTARKAATYNGLPMRLL
tara:strand:- start:4200 stop:4652 length:453 start_codon:yes stop_codon:yes gene_type:complete